MSVRIGEIVSEFQMRSDAGAASAVDGMPPRDGGTAPAIDVDRLVALVTDRVLARLRGEWEA